MAPSRRTAEEKYDTTTPLLKELLGDIDHGRIAVPRFHRMWCWSAEHTRRLIASVAEGAPIGSVVFMGARPIGHRAFESGRSNDVIAPPLKLVVDGQQRLTALYQACFRQEPVWIKVRSGYEYRLFYFQMDKAINERIPLEDPKRLTVVGVDLGLKDLMIRSDAEVVKAPKSLSKAMKRLRRAQRVLSRRQKGSANRARQARRVACIHARIADQRRNAQHQATSALVKSASAIVTEAPNVRGMIKNRNLSRSFADAGWGEVLRQIAYKAEWAGKMHVKADRFEPSTQTCCCCGHRRTGDDKLKLAQRIYRCAECDLEINRDLNAAMNLRRIGLKTLFVGQPIIVETVGRVPPERGALPLRTPVESPLPGSGHLSRSGMTSPKQEVQPSNLG